MPNAELGPEYSLAKRLTTLEGLVRGLQTRDVLQNASIGSGGLTITDGGFLVVDGDATFNGSLTVPSGSLNTGGSLTVGGAITAGTSIAATTQLSGASLAIIGGGAFGGTVSANVFSGNTLSIGGGGTIAGGINSVGVYNTDVSLLPGPRQPVWQNNNGTLGFAPSTWDKKTNVGPVQFTAADVLACWPLVFQYLGQIDIRDNPENPYYNPDYVVPWDLGLIGQQLVANNLSDFVIFAADGVTVVTIDYAGFAAVGHQVVLQDHEARMVAAGI